MILPFGYCDFLLNVDFFREFFWFYFTMKVAGAYAHNSRGKSPALSDSPGSCSGTLPGNKFSIFAWLCHVKLENPEQQKVPVLFIFPPGPYVLF